MKLLTSALSISSCTYIFSLIRQILQREPSDRIRIERIMEHAWFSDISPEDRFSPAKIQRFNPQILTKSKVQEN